MVRKSLVGELDVVLLVEELIPHVEKLLACLGLWRAQKHNREAIASKAI